MKKILFLGTLFIVANLLILGNSKVANATLSCTSPLVEYHGQCVDPIPACQNPPAHFIPSTCIDKIENGVRIYNYNFQCLEGYTRFGNQCVSSEPIPEGYYPSEAYQEMIDSVLQNPTEREFEYLLDAVIPSPRMANYIESTIYNLKDLNTERFNWFIDSNFINPPPPSPPAPPAPPGIPEPVVVWPSEAFQNTVARLVQNPSDQEFNYLLDQVIGSARAVDYVEYIVLDLRKLYPQTVNDFIQYLIQSLVTVV